MLAMLVAYDAEGNVIATLGSMVMRDESGEVVGLVDFETHEKAGGRLRDIWDKDKAVGSATWPEWLGGHAHDFTVELDLAPGAARAKIARLIHKKSGFVRERAAIDAAISERIAKAQEKGEPADLRDLVGGPDRPLKLTSTGRNRPRAAKSQRPQLPVVRREQVSPSGRDGE